MGISPIEYKNKIMIRHAERSLIEHPDSSIEELEKSPLLHQNRLPRIITKSVDDNEIKKILQNSPCAKIRFLHRDIFANEKVQEIFGPYVEEFIAALARRYKYGSNAKYRKGDGIVLRNMVENVVRYIAKKHFPNDPDLSCRDLLNHEDSGYNLQWDKLVPKDYNDPGCNLQYGINDKFDRFVFKDWCRYLDQYQVLPDINNQADIENYLKNTYPQKYNNPKYPQNAAEQAKKIIVCTREIKTLIALQAIYRNSSQYAGLPKYIFAYIDNIYTVTSEFSAHGRNDKTTKGLSTDGWSALLSGMLQIMQWVAATNPNPQSPQN